MDKKSGDNFRGTSIILSTMLELYATLSMVTTEQQNQEIGDIEIKTEQLNPLISSMTGAITE